MSEDGLLERIQALQFRDRAAAERLTLGFIRAALRLDAMAVELRPLAVSLNSFNGFVTLRDGQRLFFKTHTERDSVVGEYYQAGAMADAGYPVLQPLYRSTEVGKQLLVYPVVDDPSVFDVAWAIETGQSDALPALERAQHATDDLLAAIYARTLAAQPAEEAARAPVHQLFYHRLAGGRLRRFYGPLPGEAGAFPSVALPGGRVRLDVVRRARWTINGRCYTGSLDEAISRALRLLNPAQDGPSIVGHGDAHNGNLFFQDADPPRLLYFDPAFAGRHSPLLDLAKPLFHNVFAMWMYFPAHKRESTRIALRASGDDWQVEHDYALHPVREMFLRSKVERVLVPTLRLLEQRGELRDDWRACLKAALFCCPFLTMDLTDRAKFSPEISLLGLAMAVEMGCEADGPGSRLDAVLDEVERDM